MTADHAPLILTLEFDQAAFDVLDGLRRSHFPARLNFIPAHLTLFHHLPGERLAAVVASIERAADLAAAFPVDFTGLRRLGRGVALNAIAPEIQTVRSRVAADFVEDLTAQDRTFQRPHVTIQNKVDPAEASDLYERLQIGFQPWRGQATGLLLWRYRNGPWEFSGRFPFRCAA